MPDGQALFCQVPVSHVLMLHDVSNIWKVPIMLETQQAHVSVCSILGLGGTEHMNLSRMPLLPALISALLLCIQAQIQPSLGRQTAHMLPWDL